MAPVAVIIVSVLVAALQFNTVAGNPSVEERSWTAGQLPLPRYETYSCERFDQDYCHCFNPADRTHALFPNPRGQNAAEAKTEFSHYVQPGKNVIKNGCSNKIGTLLCFFYFPHCNPPSPENSNTVLLPDLYSLPCRALCEEVRRDCESQFNGSFQWPAHLNCSTLPSTACISGTDPAQGYDACVRPAPTVPVPKVTPTPQDIINVPMEDEHVCEPFMQSYCQCFNPDDRTHARFPNPRKQHATEAQKEFGDFIRVGRNITESGCSNKIGTLLCFFYFPHCNPPNHENSNTVLQSEDYSLPCRELCEEVRRDCESQFQNNGMSWPDHLNCSALPSVKCISGKDPDTCDISTVPLSPEAPAIITVAPEPDRVCEPFNQPYCRCFDPDARTHALFPNRRNQTARDAEMEFLYFVQPGRNVIKNNCSNKIGTLLCFFYFPPCNPPTDNNNPVTLREFLPCRQLCEEVRRDCAGEFMHHPQWQALYTHLECSRLPSTNCINGHDPTQGYDACIDGQNVVEPREPEGPTDPVTTAPPPCDPDSCPTCSLRSNCNGRTFINNAYTWAAHVTVLRLNGSGTVVGGNKAYLVQVMKQYLPDPEQGPVLSNIQIIQTTNPECCPDCPNSISVRGEYLFAGYSETNPSVWYLEVKNHGGIVSQWSQKYENNLAKWIAKALASRGK